MSQQPDLVEMVDGAFSADMVDDLAQRLGEDREATGKALRTGIPVVFRALVARAREGRGADEIAEIIRETSPGGILSEPASLLTLEEANAHERAVRTLGPEHGAVSAQVAQFADVGQPTADAVVRLVTPLALSALARTVSVPLGGENVRRLLRDQESNIDRAMPVRAGAQSTGDGVITSSPGGRRKKPNLLPWIIGIVLLAVLLYALRACGLGGGDAEKTETVLQPTTPGAAATTAPALPPTPAQTAPAAPATGGTAAPAG